MLNNLGVGFLDSVYACDCAEHRQVLSSRACQPISQPVIFARFGRFSFPCSEASSLSVISSETCSSDSSSVSSSCSSSSFISSSSLPFASLSSELIFLGSPALHSHPDIVSAVSVSSELFVPLCHSFAFSTSLARKASSSLDNRASRSTFPLIEWSLVSSSPRGIFESSIILSSLCGPETPLLFLILSLTSKFPASLSIDRSPHGSHQSLSGRPPMFVS